MFNRSILERLQRALVRGKSILLVGARQTGKTTLVKTLDSDLYVSFARPKNRQAYEKDPEQLAREIEALAESIAKTPLVILDEVQKIPVIMDIIQDLIDNEIAQFVLTGSSVQRLKKTSEQEEINTLPGRVVRLQLDPLTLAEYVQLPQINDLLLYGGLPGIVSLADADDKEEDLNSYVSTYLEEEVRAEARVRDMAPFSRFLELAANESGNIINFSKLSQEIGVSHHTIAGYFQIMKDCLMVEQIEAITKSAVRRKLTRAPKFIFSDLGIRRACAMEGLRLPNDYMGHLFEQFVGLQILHSTRSKMQKIKLCYWRAANGQEVDWVIVKGNRYIPVEVKWTDSPSTRHTKHLHLFLEEYDEADQAYVICRASARQKLNDNITALPWQEIDSIL